MVAEQFMQYLVRKTQIINIQFFYFLYFLEKVNYIVVGEDPGPSKLDKARGFNIPEIDEDKLLDLILTKSGMKPKYSKLQSEESCDSGLGSSEVISFDDSPEKKKNVDVKKKKQEIVIKDENPEILKSNLKQKPVIKEETVKKEKEEILIKEEKPNSITTTTETSVDSEKLAKEEISPKSSQELSKHQPGESLSWADKYKPQDLKGIIGQQDGASNLNKLKKWLTNWYKNQQPEIKKKILKPSPWAKNDDGAYYKAALLSGPPGVGKLTKLLLLNLNSTKSTPNYIINDFCGSN